MLINRTRGAVGRASLSIRAHAVRALERKPVTRWLPVLIFLTALCATCLLWTSARHASLAELQAEFDYRARETGTRIERRMQSYEQVLRGAQALFAAEPEVTRARFRTYIASLQ